MISAACPDEDGTRNAIGMLTRNAKGPKIAPVEPLTASSVQWMIVSVTSAFFITTVTARARTMISAAPRNSPAPATIALTVRSSPSLPIRPMTTAAMTNTTDDSAK